MFAAAAAAAFSSTSTTDTTRESPPPPPLPLSPAFPPLRSPSADVFSPLRLSRAISLRLSDCSSLARPRSHSLPVSLFRCVLVAPTQFLPRPLGAPSRVEPPFRAPPDSAPATQRNQTRAGSRVRRGVVLPRMAEASALLGLCPVFASSCVPADVLCTRDWYAQLTRPYANPLLCTCTRLHPRTPLSIGHPTSSHPSRTRNTVLPLPSSHSIHPHHPLSFPPPVPLTSCRSCSPSLSPRFLGLRRLARAFIFVVPLPAPRSLDTVRDRRTRVPCADRRGTSPRSAGGFRPRVPGT